MLRMPLDLSFHAVIFYSVFEGDTCTGEEDDQGIAEDADLHSSTKHSNDKLWTTTARSTTTMMKNNVGRGKVGHFLVNFHIFVRSLAQMCNVFQTHLTSMHNSLNKLKSYLISLIKGLISSINGKKKTNFISKPKFLVAEILRIFNQCNFLPSDQLEGTLICFASQLPSQLCPIHFCCSIDKQD